MRKLNLQGKRFGSLVALEPTSSREIGSNGQPRTAWICKCDCGKKVVVDTAKLRKGRKTSCGCQTLKKNGKPKKRPEHHGDNTRNSRLYRIWNAMLLRCGYHAGAEPRVKAAYEDRGIRVCKEWQESYVAFKSWALENGYADNLSIDRIDNNGNYEPTNCRWATAKTQAQNTRKPRPFVTVGIIRRLDAMAQTLAEASENSDLLTRLEALAAKLAKQIDETDGRGLASLAREYRQTVEAIAAIKKTDKQPEGIDDLIEGKAGPDLRRLSVA